MQTNVNNYSYKMQGRLLQELTDFTGLGKRVDDSGPIYPKRTGGPPELDTENNEMILKSFRELRDKLKTSQRENQHLREDMKALQIDVVQLHESESNLMTINHQLKQKNIQTGSALDEIRRVNVLLREGADEKDQVEMELQLMKGHLVQAQLRGDQFEEQKSKLIEISIEDKLSLEEVISKMRFKGSSDEQYICQVENQLSRGKEEIMKLENKCKKMEIKHDEEVFHRQWSKDNFQQEKQEAYIKELEGEVAEGKGKYRKERERRNQIEKRVLQLEEVAGLSNVKAEVYEGEVDLITKKYKKMERRMSTAKVAVSKMTSQKLGWEERFFKTVSISEQLINRVKRQLFGDMVELAKTCEFRINKLKDGREDQLPRSSIGREGYSSGTKKLSKTDKKEKERKSNEKYCMTAAKTMAETEITSNKLVFEGKGVLTESQANCEQKAKTADSCKGEWSGLGNKREEDENQFCGMQAKIRRQREEMQKKLRERMLFRKIETGCGSDKARLREDYLRQILQK